ncbi:MAG: glycosyltransferase [Leptolyngbyaceae cyanobacterium CSU_1_4]|nr:glycosyltransferase [Leptolyngbyaceae cyanobacterium CSU_1_4]
MTDDPVTDGTVSVIIPCHNGADLLADAIDSVLAQTYPAREILVIDDGSRDGTEAIATPYAAPVRYIRQPCQGVSAARNTGIQASQGSYLVFLDHDDRLLPHALEIGVDCLAKYPNCGFAYGRHQNIDSAGNLVGRATDGGQTHQEDKLKVSVANDYALMLSGEFPVPPARIMFRRQVFEQIGGFDLALTNSQDYDLCLRAAAQFLAGRHNQVIAEYRQHDASKSSTTAVTRKLAFTLRALQKQWSRVEGDREYRRAYRAGSSTFKGCTDAIFPTNWRPRSSGATGVMLAALRSRSASITPKDGCGTV